MPKATGDGDRLAGGSRRHHGGAAPGIQYQIWYFLVLNTKITDDKQKIHSQKMVLKVKVSKINFKGLDCILTSRNRPFSALSGCAAQIF